MINYLKICTLFILLGAISLHAMQVDAFARLKRAVIKDDVATVRSLAPQCRLVINTPVFSGQTVLYWPIFSVYGNNPEERIAITRILLEAGASKMHQDSLGRTPYEFLKSRWQYDSAKGTLLRLLNPDDERSGTDDEI